METKITKQLLTEPRLTQLDGLRGLAILGVLGNHFGQYNGNFQSGWLGVSLFFVLSGFLITRILINQKKLMEENHSGFLYAFKTFYIRRAFRIFPLYYLVLLTLFLFDLNNARQLSFSLITYTFNFIVSGGNFSGPNHLWSLSVEEQFYLVWPAIVLLSPLPKLPYYMGIVFLIAPLWRLACFFLQTTREPMHFSTLACLDCLAAGSLLAWCEFKGHRAWTIYLSITKISGVIMMAVWAILSFNLIQIQWGAFRLNGLLAIAQWQYFLVI